MNLLALDTSTEMATVALAVEGTIQSLEQNSVREHAKHLLPMIQTLLQTANTSWAALDGIVFGSGPGSFTGLRIACSIAKALAYTHSLPLFGVSSMDAIAHQTRMMLKSHASSKGILAILDARMQEVYWAYYPPGVKMATEIQVGSPHTVTVPENQPFVLAGWGLEAYQTQWSEALCAGITSQYSIAPNAHALIELVQTGEISATSAAKALPLYVRDQVAHIGEKRG
ncbi:MAG: tRNA (adenosine(37)-N6)-threonylcarbamoyltransferase complex dimerization subunit type 1 TsaB [Legionella sp.]|nr:MAG: tRNA (adenosine(37)-N6)-threonylcarbamoyltransferase complex dimerization subunit type 1 TsaB [Legionella sp.]